MKDIYNCLEMINTNALEGYNSSIRNGNLEPVKTKSYNPKYYELIITKEEVLRMKLPPKVTIENEIHWHDLYEIYINIVRDIRIKFERRNQF